MRVMLVDDHELVWNGTRRLLEQVLRDTGTSDELEFRAARDVEAACAQHDRPFDLVLLDYHLPGEEGLSGLRRIQAVFDGASICMLSAESNSQAIREVLESGASGFIPKSYSGSEMASALSLVLRRKVYVPAEFLFVQEVERGSEPDELPSEDLTAYLHNVISPRQREVLSLALQGLPNKLIARRLDIAENTVKVHLSTVYRALGVKNRVAALCRVLQAGAADALG